MVRPPCRRLNNITNFACLSTAVSVGPRLLHPPPTPPLPPSARPTQTVVGGAINGQVVMWDISKALASIDQKKRKQSVRHIGKPGLGVGDEEEVSAALPPVQPHAVSHIDMSHRRLVADLAWLPTTTQVTDVPTW